MCVMKYKRSVITITLHWHSYQVSSLSNYVDDTPTETSLSPAQYCKQLALAIRKQSSVQWVATKQAAALHRRRVVPAGQLGYGFYLRHGVSLQVRRRSCEKRVLYMLVWWWSGFQVFGLLDEGLLICTELIIELYRMIKQLLDCLLPASICIKWL